MSGLILAVPSKGRLQEQTNAYFADCGMAIVQAGGGRGYSAAIRALPDVEVRLLSAGDIVGALRCGEVHAGVTGEDLLREDSADLGPVTLARALGFGRADLIVAVPAAWLDVTTMADLAEAAADLRARMGRRLRVATKYLNQTRAFFARHAIADYRLVESLGATEGAPAAGAAEAIVDITTTGATLAANHLRPLADGLILSSQAQLAASAAAAWDDRALAAFERLLASMEARARAQTLRLLRAGSVAADAAAQIAALGARPAGAAGGEGWLAPAAAVPAIAAALEAAGAGPVSVFDPDYVFDSPVEGYVRVREAIKRYKATLPS